MRFNNKQIISIIVLSCFIFCSMNQANAFLFKSNKKNNNTQAVSATKSKPLKKQKKVQKEEHESHGLSIYDAAIKAALLRFRAIMMTEAAFILGILPLLFASGAGANSRISVGSTVIGGMIIAATLGTVLTPAFYVIIQDMVDKQFNSRKDEEDEI